MKKMMKQILSAILSVLLCLSTSTTVFAEEERAQETDLKTIIVNQDTLNLDSADVKEYAEYGRQLAAVLKGVDNQGEDKAIKAFCESHKNPVFERIDGVIAENSRSGKNIYLKMTSGFNEEYEKTYKVDDKRSVIITPTYIVLDVLTVDEKLSDSSGLKAGTSSTSGTCSKTYYGTNGNKLFSLTVECSFYYNGSKAWYKSGFDYYYSKGTLSVWQVSNWKGWKEASGTSYKAYCSGNFHWGIEYGGNGLVIQDYYCKNTLTCSKNGTITKSTTMS